MYEHLVFFKFHTNVASAKQQELLDQLLGFRDQIPGIVDISAGLNVTEETDNVHGYTLGLRVTFDNLESLRAYGPHPVHQEFVKSLDGLLDNVIVVDYPKV
ncbi:Dabb family protein [Paenibacillus sp. LHD-117]|uniref:Dabb family protein n=1 Tax=Paenibacillus sp. LHD-117 TaxID=3071412 RepID=UPI0027DEB371|nr:Dabb family protein [Paenibacillus sp. LHD-117]MDQ6420400.1 Dabb family protein [Paenibacillus sp. LHD-117]